MRRADLRKIPFGTATSLEGEIETRRTPTFGGSMKSPKNPNDVARHYLSAWNEPDAQKRRALIE